MGEIGTAVLDVDWITFDCYGTLIDWNLGMRQFVTRLLINKRVSIPPEEILKVWEPIQFKLLRGPFRRYREILAVSLEEALRGVKVQYVPEDGQRLASAMGAWRPFREVAGALARLKTRYKMGVLSNTDRDILTRSLSHLGTAMDLALTSEEVRAYKPAVAGFRELVRRAGAAPERVLHAAFGAKYDLQPAREAGMKVCLVQRKPRPGKVPGEPNLVVQDLAALADAMSGNGP